MPIRPHEDEDQTAFMRRCMRELIDSPTKRPRDQMVAICLSAWREGPAKQEEMSDGRE